MKTEPESTTTNESESMIAVHFDGGFVKEDTITARTLGHALTSLQRMVDKTVIYDKRGSLKKGDVLPNVWYSEADLIVKPFKKGCVTVPLVGLENANVISRLKGILQDPFQEATSDRPINKKTLADSLPDALNRAKYRMDLTTHSKIIEDAKASEQRYFAEAVFRDFDNLISPLRSSSITVQELISLELRDRNGVAEYEFDRATSTRFHKIVSAKQLGPTVLYSGRLTEFGETKSRHFPYSGRFYSDASKHEHKLLVSNESDADSLRMFNTNKNKELTFIGAPITAWGAFDERKGDIVFLLLSGED